MTKRTYSRRHVMLVSHALTKTVEKNQSKALRAAWWIEKSNINVSTVMSLLRCTEVAAISVTMGLYNLAGNDPERTLAITGLSLWNPEMGKIVRLYPKYGINGTYKDTYLDITEIYNNSYTAVRILAHVCGDVWLKCYTKEQAEHYLAQGTWKLERKYMEKVNGVKKEHPVARVSFDKGYFLTPDSKTMIHTLYLDEKELFNPETVICNYKTGGEYRARFAYDGKRWAWAYRDGKFAIIVWEKNERIGKEYVAC